MSNLRLLGLWKRIRFTGKNKWREKLSIVEVTTKPVFHDFFLTKFFSLDEDFLTKKTTLGLCGVNFWCGVLCEAYFLSVKIFVKKTNLRQEKNKKWVLLWPRQYFKTEENDEI